MINDKNTPSKWAEQWDGPAVSWKEKKFTKGLVENEQAKRPRESKGLLTPC